SITVQEMGFTTGGTL
nr:immunoglobulin heavy chain junction region [Mus musculus]